MTGEHIENMARQLRFQPRFVMSVARELADKMPAAMQRAVDAVMPSLPRAAQDLAERLKRFVLSTTKKTAVRVAG